jgi:hypothetical protein
MTTNPVEAAAIAREIRNAVLRLLNCSLSTQQRAGANLLMRESELLLSALEHELGPRQREL